MSGVLVLAFLVVNAVYFAALVWWMGAVDGWLLRRQERRRFPTAKAKVLKR